MAEQLRELVNRLNTVVQVVYILGVTVRDHQCFPKIKQLNEIVRLNADQTYTYIPISRKMSSLRNVDDDGIHLSIHGATNLMSVIRSFLRS